MDAELLPEVDPSPHAYPWEHGPVHDALVRPWVAPYRPLLHGSHWMDCTKLYLPAGQIKGAMPGVGHTYPAGHWVQLTAREAL